MNEQHERPAPHVPGRVVTYVEWVCVECETVCRLQAGVGFDRNAAAWIRLRCPNCGRVSLVRVTP